MQEDNNVLERFKEKYKKDKWDTVRDDLTREGMGKILESVKKSLDEAERIVKLAHEADIKKLNRKWQQKNFSRIYPRKKDYFHYRYPGMNRRDMTNKYIDENIAKLEEKVAKYGGKPYNEAVKYRISQLNIANIKHKIKNNVFEMPGKFKRIISSKAEMKDFLIGNIRIKKGTSNLTPRAKINLPNIKGAIKQDGVLGSVLKGGLKRAGSIINIGWSVAKIAKARPEEKGKTAAKEVGGLLGGAAANAMIMAGLGMSATGVGILPGLALVAGGVLGSLAGEAVGEWVYDNRKKITDGVKGLGTKAFGAFKGGTQWIGKKVETIRKDPEKLVKGIGLGVLASPFIPIPIKSAIFSIGLANKFFKKKLPSHYNGLSYVPYDGYIAELHKGERVLTDAENKEYGSRKSAAAGNPASKGGGNTFNITINGVNKSTNEIINELVAKIKEAAGTMGEVVYSI